MKKVLFILNPASAGGKTAARWQSMTPKLKQALLSYRVLTTKKQGCAQKFAYDAAMNNCCDLIVSVGGDGTVNEIVNGLMQAAPHVDVLPALSIFPSGTGSDSVRTLGIPKDLDGFVRLIQTGVPKSVDVGRVDFVLADEAKKTRYFLNACDVGIGATVAQAVNLMNKDQEQKSGKSKYFRSILKQAVRFKTFDAVVLADEVAHPLKKTVIVSICNGMFFGGGVKVSPLSRMNDGLLECVATRNISKPALLDLITKVYRGSHLGHAKVAFHQGARFCVQLDVPQLLETDGEVQGAVVEATFTPIKGGLHMLH